MTSCDVIGLQLVTISLVTLYNYFLTVEYYTKDTQEISCGQLPYRRRERSMFVIYSSAHQYLTSTAFFSTFMFITIHQTLLFHQFSTDLSDSTFLYEGRQDLGYKTPNLKLKKKKTFIIIYIPIIFYIYTRFIFYF